MLKRKKKSIINNEKGMAIFEMIPIIIVLVLLFNYSFGFFGAIHTGILNSIGARNYAFATFSHRANLVYLRNTDPPGGGYSASDIHYEKKGCRIHAIASGTSTNWPATQRYLNFFELSGADTTGTSKTTHNNDVNTITESARNDKTGVNPIWIKTSYGICLNVKCTGT